MPIPDPTLQKTVTTVGGYFLVRDGAPSGTANEGALWVRTDAPHGVWQMRSGSWVAV